MGRAADTAYTAIKERIVRGRLTPNTTVDESEIANELGMSRTPVREALLRLQTESLVDIARGRGIRVLPISITDMREAYQVISGLEMVAVQLLSERAPDAAYLAPLAETVARMRAAQDAGDVMGWCDADEDFHRTLMRLSGNTRLASAGIQMRDFARRAHVVAVRLQSAEYTRTSTENHAALVDALASGSFELAVEKHLLQRRRGEGLLIGAVEAMNFSAL
ncbi:GntR family transcriptional regulator [Acuticoccus yangtzensis]|uniref:GntR family transcriptional regulator n=1 Tax=Acuticoccus yangtzensis TaxID=1443441 RepID=UPI00094980E6|nr:GntR family transcriptional regulator [Acuticoccus yangtzensis]